VCVCVCVCVCVFVCVCVLAVLDKAIAQSILIGEYSTGLFITI